VKSRGLTETIIRLGALLAFCLGLELAIPVTILHIDMVQAPVNLRSTLAGVSASLGMSLALALLFGLSRRIAARFKGPEPPVAQGPGYAIVGGALLVRGAAGLGAFLVTDHLGLMFAPAPLLQMGMGLALLGRVMGLGGLWRGAMAQRPKL
jgi:hypothetical protein